MANPVDAAAEAANATVRSSGGALSSLWKVGKFGVKATMVVGGLVGLFAIVGALTSPAGLAALAPHVNLAAQGGTTMAGWAQTALGALGDGAATVGQYLSGVDVASAPLPDLG